MAITVQRKKTPRTYIQLACTVCDNYNYTTEKNRQNTEERLYLSKYCSSCGKHTEHKEVKKRKKGK